jgi:hypothetical protein
MAKAFFTNSGSEANDTQVCLLCMLINDSNDDDYSKNTVLPCFLFLFFHLVGYLLDVLNYLFVGEASMVL